MNLKKLTAGLTALVCCAGVLTCMPEISWRTSAETAVKNDFEVNYDGWYGNADAVVLSAENEIGFDGSRGMTVTGRTIPSDGASSSKGFYLMGGVKYDYSVYVYSETDETFNLSLVCKDEETDKETKTVLVSKKVKAGVWTELSADYTAPKNSYDFLLTITTDSVNNFSFDNVTITTKQKSDGVYAATAEKGLKDEFANYFRVGNILNSGTIQSSAITANIIKDFNSIECENETKPYATLVQSQCSGTDIGVSLKSASAIFDFCIQNNIAVRGHTFVWHSQTPSWFFKENYNNNGAWVSKTTMDARIESYIKNMFAAIEKQYPDLDLYAYDVANECVSDDANRTANNGGARVAGDNNVTGGTSAWVSVYGDNSFVEKAFRYAREYAPEGCDLYYNDYNEYWDHKRDCIYNMCKSLYEKGLLDGVGMQSHVPANATGFAGTDSYLEAMDKYLSIGCDVQVTELDISLENGKYSLQDQANKYKAIFQHAMEYNSNPKYSGRVSAVCIWGPNDANSWLESGSNALLYDSNNKPKLAYTTLTSMIPQSEWGDGSNPSGSEVKPNEYGWYFHSTFEGDTDSWQARGAADVLTSGRIAYVGDESLLVENRTAAWNGASRTLSPRAFVPGNDYSFSVNVMYFDGAATDKFYLKLQYTDADGETQYSTVAEGTAVKGEWIQLANKNYEIPSDAKNMQIYVETAETTNNFYIDEAIGAVGGTTILGAGEGKEIVLGDVNSDGEINIFDWVLAKRGLLGGFNNKSAEIAADVDQSGKVDEEDIALIRDYLLNIITEFPVAEKVVDVAAMESLFANVKYASSLKNDTENNPLWTQRFGADPGFMVYKDRLYVYTTNDAVEYNSAGQIQVNTYDSGTINCFSSADLVNWTDHGAIPVAGRNGRTENGAAKWATYAWAPDAAWKTINGKDKFFLYFADSAGGIGVLTADSPAGPWSDPLGHALINKSTNGYGNVEWLFDPAVLVDDDGTGYLYCGGGVPSGQEANPKTARVVKLGDDMISLSGSPNTIDAPYLFEDSSILKVDGTYYYSYCTNWSTGGNPYGFANAEIAVMTSSSPMGPFTYSNIALKNPASYKLDGGGNNHHSIVEFKGNYYMLYHTRNLSRAMNIQALNKDGTIDLGGNYRSPHLDKATLSGGKFASTGTMKGVDQIETLDPYVRVQAETMSNQAGINISGLGDTVVSDIDKGDWIKVSGVEFSKDFSTITVRASSVNGSAIKVCTGSPDSKSAIAYVEIPASGAMSEITVPVVNTVTGTKDLYFAFSGQAEFDYWYFS